MINVSWEPEQSPRQAGIVVGFQSSAEALYRRIRWSDSSLESASVLLGQSFLAIKADFATLPWVDGLHYLSMGLSEQDKSSRLYTPAHLKPNVPYAWLAASLKKLQRKPQAGNHHRCDILYLPSTHSVIFADSYKPLAAAQHDHLLELWYEHHSRKFAALGG